MYRIKEVCPEDREGMHAFKTLFKEYKETLDIDLGFQHLDEEFKNLPGAYAPPTGCMLVAFSEIDPVGCVAVRQLGDDICEGKHLYVCPDFRSSGVGRALAIAGIDKARQIGYSRMRFDTVVAHKQANSLYRSLGCKEIEPYYSNPLPEALFLEIDIT